jgi:hypothetical protein
MYHTYHGTSTFHHVDLWVTQHDVSRSSHGAAYGTATSYLRRLLHHANSHCLLWLLGTCLFVTRTVYRSAWEVSVGRSRGHEDWTESITRSTSIEADPQL